jgi:hypothetical protein
MEDVRRRAVARRSGLSPSQPSFDDIMKQLAAAQSALDSTMEKRGRGNR